MQERILRVKIQHREEQLEGGEVGMRFCSNGPLKPQLNLLKMLSSHQLMVRGGEREAGLRARIEALLATLEKLGRCDLLYVLHRL